MRVLFVHSEQDAYAPEKPVENLERMQFGVSYISAMLKREGHETRLAVLSRDTGGRALEFVRSFDPGLVCFTSVYSEFDFLAGEAARIKRAFPGVFLVAGGTHVTLNPERCLDSAFDAVCVGEGEYATLELVEQLESGKRPGGIPNLYFKRPDGIEKNPPRPFIEDLDSLPFPDREMWKPWLAWPLSRPSVLVGRGCPFRCTYCCNHALMKHGTGTYVRVRSPGNIAEEVRALKEEWPEMGSVYLEVETMGYKLDWALELCSELERLNAGFETPVAFGSNLRVTPNSDYEALFSAFKRSNFDLVNIGLESGSERVRREILKRHYSNEDIISAVENARKHGLKVGIYNLIGIPGETAADFRETVRVNRACRPDWYLLSVFFPYPGTRLHDTCRELGLLDDFPDHDLERRRPVFDLPGFSKRQLNRRLRWSALLIYGGYRPIGAVLWLVVMGRIFSNRTLLRYYRRRQNRLYRGTQAAQGELDSPPALP